jgi:hypothetical protein
VPIEDEKSRRVDLAYACGGTVHLHRRPSIARSSITPIPSSSPAQFGRRRQGSKNRCRSGFPNRQNRFGKPVKPTGKPKRAVC